MVIQIQRKHENFSVREIHRTGSSSAEPMPAPFRMVLRRPVMSGYACIPAIDLFSRTDAMVLRMDLPGITRDDVEVMAIENRLTVSGKRKPAEGFNKDDYRINEVSYGYFSRTFNLPVMVDTSKIEADLHDGILEITLPKVQGDSVTAVTIKDRAVA